MSTNTILQNIRVSSPCTARWADMTGDVRARFCAQCQKHVYNLSEMTAEGAADLIREKEGKLCARFYQRADGTMLTADCPVGVASSMRRLKRLAAAGIAILLPAFAARTFVETPIAQTTPAQPRARLYRTWDKAVSTVQNWVNPAPVR